MEELKNKIKVILMKYELNNEEMEDAIIDMVEREFPMVGIPKDEELEKYVDDYMDR